MRQRLIRLSQRYVAALRIYLKPGRTKAGANAAATSLGRGAVALGVETLGLARMHRQALVTLGLARDKTGRLRRAEVFFTKANIPIEATHRAARKSKRDLQRLKQRLSQCILELAGHNQPLPAGLSQPAGMKGGLAASGKHHHKCLAESLQLQKLLRQRTHQALTAREEDRTKLSHELQDEVAQSLVGIKVRLLVLKEYDGRNSKSFKNEIASAQRLVLKSAQSVRRFARELDSPATAVQRAARKLI